MMKQTPTLHMICGKIASRKSTFARELSRTGKSVLLSEDAWLKALYADDLQNVSDYVRYASRLRAALGPHIRSLLYAELSVVLDFPANTVETRSWMRSLFTETGAAHKLHVFDVADETCLARLRERNARGSDPFAATEEQYWGVAKHFSLPSPDEGFALVMHTAKT